MKPEQVRPRMTKAYLFPETLLKSMDILGLKGSPLSWSLQDKEGLVTVTLQWNPKINSKRAKSDKVSTHGLPVCLTQDMDSLTHLVPQSINQAPPKRKSPSTLCRDKIRLERFLASKSHQVPQTSLTQETSPGIRTLSGPSHSSASQSDTTCLVKQSTKSTQGKTSRHNGKTTPHFQSKDNVQPLVSVSTMTVELGSPAQSQVKTMSAETQTLNQDCELLNDIKDLQLKLSNSQQMIKDLETSLSKTEEDLDHARS